MLQIFGIFKYGPFLFNENVRFESTSSHFQLIFLETNFGYKVHLLRIFSRFPKN